MLALTAGGRRRVYFAIVRHVGRRTGRAYATPVMALPTRDGFLVPLTYGTRADWCRNVLAASAATITHRGRTVTVDRPEVVDAATVLPRLSPVRRAIFRLVGMRQFLLLRRGCSAGGRPVSVRRAVARPC